jgi:hypothetical protein
LLSEELYQRLLARPGLFADELRALRPVFEDIFYWAPLRKSEVEVDFLLACGKELIAVEVKSGDTLQD